VLHSLVAVWTAAAHEPHAPRHWRPVKTSKLVHRDRLLLLFPSVPAVHLLVTCKANQQHKQFRLSLFSDLSRPLLDLLRCKSAAAVHPLLPCSMYWQQGVLEAGDRRWRRSAAAASGRSVGTAENRLEKTKKCSIWGKKGTTAGLCFFFYGGKWAAERDPAVGCCCRWGWFLWVRPEEKTGCLSCNGQLGRVWGNLKFLRKLQLDFRLFLQFFLVSFLCIASFYFIFSILIFFYFKKKWIFRNHPKLGNDTLCKW
jgi:hypothetical protein